MVYINMRVHHGGAFGYEDGVFKYLKGQTTIIEDIEGDQWYVFEAYKELRQLGYLQYNIAALWYKDPSLDDSENNLKMLKGDADAIEMCNIARLRGLVELFVVHDVGDAEGFSDVDYIDVGGVAEERDTTSLDMVVFDDDGAEAVEGSGEHNKGTQLGGQFGGDRNESSDEDSDDPEYLPSDEEGDSACDIHFTNSEEEYEYDSGFGKTNSVPNKDTAAKGKGVGTSQLSDEEGVDSDELEIDNMIGGNEVEDDDPEEDADDASDRGGQRFPVHKPEKDMTNYRWKVRILYASRQEFKDTVLAYAVHTARSIKFKKCDLVRVRTVCQKDCPF
ncbi:hypothetical protein Ahy_B02g060764 [Arachis hypogaea]|uniref:PB1-like domain-containing protein n=1 Tax=Arachis hypogaea TaxID=3818 RepID=A0A445AJF6_ARAHY|nr:hypothetical protein Ahy_B02g060764 [Arachis hypogaea]